MGLVCRKLGGKHNECNRTRSEVIRSVYGQQKNYSTVSKHNPSFGLQNKHNQLPKRQKRVGGTLVQSEDSARQMTATWEYTITMTRNINIQKLNACHFVLLIH